MADQEPEDPIQKKITQFYRETLKMQKMQNVGLISTVKSLREEMENTRSKQENYYRCQNSTNDSEILF